MSISDKFLTVRSGGVYYFKRNVPVKIRSIDGRAVILATLKTTDQLLARKRRDEMVRLTDSYWAGLLRQGDATKLKNIFNLAMERAKYLGLDYLTSQELIDKSNIDELVTRIKQLESTKTPEHHLDMTSVLGLEDRPHNTVSQVLEIYFKKIAVQDQENKTPDQVRVWKKAKSRAFTNFINLVGDISIDKITRKNALDFFDWWMKRVSGQIGTSMAPGTAQKDLGNLKKIYAEYYRYYGDEDRQNPFRNLRFKNVDINKRPAFKVEDIKKIFNSDIIQNLNFEARMIMFVCADTGCRPSEICGLTKDNIHLDEKYPYIEIKDMPGRKLKTRSSNRKVPLIGVALEAMKLIPNGPTRYKFKETILSSTVNKFLRSNEFLPTSGHSFYSFRHSIMDRMEEVDIEDELRRRILGHSINKPNYGDGGSSKFVYEKLKKIEMKYHTMIFNNLD